ncbi:MAG: hypothetical protein M1572_02410 [Gammaproteobacteria bacterium]|nr:hypothetical protein [Gammaproteobacteria bacterium]MCL5796557.1 hypothetical protein [Gammaproteobacteria bacterium]
MNRQFDKQVFLVLGMHRSGTSAITRALQVMGIGLGDNLVQAVGDVNAKGFWEDLDVVNLNIRILASIKSDWHALSLVSGQQFEHLIRGPLFNEACALMQQKLANTNSLGLKDPRIAKLVPFWQAVFKALGVQVKYIIAIRNPLSIADSLRKRDGFNQSKSLWLWFGHVVESLAHTKTAQRIIVDYDILLNDATKQCQRMANAFSLTINQLALAEYQAEFLDRGLRHSQYSLADLQLVDQSINQVFYGLYHDLTEAATDQTKLDDWQQQKLSSYYQHMNAQKLLFAFIDEQQHTINQCPKAFDSAVIRLAYQQTDIQREVVLSRSIKLDCQQPQQFEFALSNLHSINQIRLMLLNERCVIQLHELSSYSEDGQHVDLIPYLQGNQLIRHGNNYFFDQKNPELVLSHKALSANLTLTKIQLSLSYAHMGEDALLITMKQLSIDFEQTQGELAQTQGELAQTQGELAQTQGELAQTQGELAQTQANLHLILNSRSWKLTSGFRKLGQWLNANK